MCVGNGRWKEGILAQGAASTTGWLAWLAARAGPGQVQGRWVGSGQWTPDGWLDGGVLAAGWTRRFECWPSSQVADNACAGETAPIPLYEKRAAEKTSK